MLRKMTMADIAQVVEIHATSWAKHELSVKLGKKFINAFYTQIMKSDDAFVFVYEQDGSIVSYATGFSDYQKFGKSFSRENLLLIGALVVGGILGRRVTLGDICNIFKEERKVKNAKFGKHHLGALALKNEFKKTAIGREGMNSVIVAVMNEFRRLGYPGCCLHCDSINIPMRKYMTKLGFSEIEEIAFFGKKIVLYEHSFLN